jgi:iron complex outermembrane receptor protein
MLCASELQAVDADEPITILVEGSRLSDVSGEQVKSADLAEALTRNVPGVSLVRRSGIANDIILRGQKKDNINVLVDNTKVYGACPNRMDPPTSHILTNNIDSIDIIEGPYDVENFGTLSGAVNITTRKPSQELKGEGSVNFGSWEYRKAAATLSGGSERTRMLVSVSDESSGQYEDGNGNDFAEQIDALNPTTMPAMDPRYKDKYRDRDAYDKQTFMGKFYLDVTSNQQFRFSYTANRSDDVLYPSSMMDALKDNSDIYNLEYSIDNLGRYAKTLELQYYDSSVDHPMSTFYRVSSGDDSANERISDLSTSMRGVKLKNSFDLTTSSELTVGLDTSVRNWDGTYKGKGTSSMITGRKSIDNVDTDNRAIFVELSKRYDKVDVKLGARYDDTSIEPGDRLDQPDNDYRSLSGNIYASYHASNNTRFFGGVGKASRVPDARELYFHNAMAIEVGTPNLNDTSNYEIDLGVEKRFDRFRITTSIFHSWLKDYIYYNADKTSNAFENIDARIYGADVAATYTFDGGVWFDFGLAYQRGKKDQPLPGQRDEDLAEIPPLKANLSLNYQYGNRNTASVELIAADDWDKFDSDNGEQNLDSYVVVNMKIKHNVHRNFELTAGLDNVFNQTFATTNTYKDLTLLLDTTGDVMLMNEPGRYLYMNASYRF